jgi:hypothetical protein
MDDEWTGLGLYRAHLTRLMAHTSSTFSDRRLPSNSPESQATSLALAQYPPVSPPDSKFPTNRPKVITTAIGAPSHIVGPLYVPSARRCRSVTLSRLGAPSWDDNYSHSQKHCIL